MDVQQMDGILSALITPFDPDYEVKYPELRRIVRYQLALGVAGFYVCGSTGESFSLSPGERKKILETVVEEVGGRAGVIANISHMEYRVAYDLSDHAKSSGADAVSTLPPIYFPVTPEEVRRYYLSVLDQARLPVTIYNIPVLSGRTLDDKMVDSLAAHPNFVGIKHTSEDFDMLNRFKQVDGGRLMVWNARDAYYVSGLAMGADGAIGSSYNLYADVYNLITRSFRDSAIEKARALQSGINRVQRQLYRFGAYQSIKRCFALIGIDAGGCRPPFGKIDDESDEHLRQVLEMLKDFRRQWGLEAPPVEQD